MNIQNIYNIWKIYIQSEKPATRKNKYQQPLFLTSYTTKNLRSFTSIMCIIRVVHFESFCIVFHVKFSDDRSWFHTSSAFRYLKNSITNRRAFSSHNGSIILVPFKNSSKFKARTNGYISDAIFLTNNIYSVKI